MHRPASRHVRNVVLRIAAAALIAAAFDIQPAAGAASPSMVGGWRFDEGGGQRALDDGPYGLDGRLGSSDAVDASDPARITGLSGGALRFDGASYVRLPNSAALDMKTLSVEAVVRAGESPGAWRHIVSRGGYRCFAGSFGLYSGKGGGVAFYVYDGSHYVVSAAGRPADIWNGAWHHVTGTYDGQSLRLYIDGAPVGEPVNVPVTIDYRTTSLSTFLGQYAGSCALGFVGDVDMVTLLSGALGAEAVSAAARAALKPGTKPGSRLPAAAPGGVIWNAPPAGSGKRRRGERGAPASACVVRASRKRIHTRRRSRLVVRVSLRGTPLAKVRVTMRRAGRHKVIARGRTSAAGRARLRFLVQRSGRLRITARHAAPRCTAAYVRAHHARHAG
jgi:hypothetical protein